MSDGYLGHRPTVRQYRPTVSIGCQSGVGRLKRVSDGCRMAFGRHSSCCDCIITADQQPSNRVSYLSVSSDCIITADRQPSDRVSDGCRSFIWNILPLSDGCRLFILHFQMHFDVGRYVSVIQMYRSCRSGVRRLKRIKKRVSDGKKWCRTAVGRLLVGCRSGVRHCRSVPSDSVGRLSDGFLAID